MRFPHRIAMLSTYIGSWNWNKYITSKTQRNAKYACLNGHWQLGFMHTVYTLRCSFERLCQVATSRIAIVIWKHLPWFPLLQRNKLSNSKRNEATWYYMHSFSALPCIYEEPILVWSTNVSSSKMYHSAITRVGCGNAALHSPSYLSILKFYKLPISHLNLAR